jgi:hypothetical protein
MEQGPSGNAIEASEKKTICGGWKRWTRRLPARARAQGAERGAQDCLLGPGW